jgi:peptide/nickel transport system substrate-binding protein
MEPDVAAGYEMDQATNTFTIFMREGLKWSDGVPLTSEDVRFCFEDMHMNPDVRTWGGIGVTGVEVVDDLTVKLIKDGGLGIIELNLSDWFGSQITSFQPAHYLKKWHGDYNPDAEKLAQEEGFDHWYGNGGAMMSHYWWGPQKEVNLPSVSPFFLVQSSTTTKKYERNPYHFRIDPAGNQLPYLDGFTIAIVDQEVYQLKVSQGAADIAFTGTRLDNYSLYKTNEEIGNFNAVLYPDLMSSAYTLDFILTNQDPVIRPLINNLKFRQALSVAINRDEINEILTFGMGRTGNVAPLHSNSYYQEGWREHYAQYDPDLANKLLDEIGLDKRDGEGFRLGPDGKKFNWLVDITSNREVPLMELIKEYWEDVGVRTIPKLMEPGLQGERMAASETMMWVHPWDQYPHSSERFAFASVWHWSDDGGHAPHWATWLNEHNRAVKESLAEGEPFPVNWRTVETGKEDTYGGEKPPDYWIEAHDREDRWLLTSMGSPEYMELAVEVFDFYVNNIFKIGTVGEVPKVLVYKKNLGNVPPPGYITGYPLGPRLMYGYVDQLFWKE